MKKVAVILAGCGNLDGSEITEAVSALIALTELGAQVTCFAPSIDFQTKSYPGLESPSVTRNTLIEAARIARGKIHNLNELNQKEFDALVIPGGYGAATHLSSFASQGSKAKILPDLQKIIMEFHGASKPIGAICIAPSLLALALGQENVNVTIGNDADTASELERTGAHHSQCLVNDYISDRDHKVLTTPAYMYGNASSFEVFTGIRKMIQELVEMA